MEQEEKENKQQFYQYIEKAKQWFFDAIKKSKKPIRIISHFDADGITSAAILIKTLDRLNIEYVVSIVEQLDAENIKTFSEQDFDVFIFSDLGSGPIDTIIKEFSKNKVLVLDHHKPKQNFKFNENIFHVNPHLFGIDGNSQISGAGVCFLFSNSIDKNNKDLSVLSLIGAIGDMQENNGFKGLNKDILEIAENNKLIKVKKAIKLFGVQTRPLHKMLQYSSVQIPELNTESDAIQFLKSIGIEPLKDGKWKRFIDLTEKEKERLATAIIIKRMNSNIKSPEDIFGYNYTLENEKQGTIFRDIREFSTLLNACGRMNRSSIGLGSCLGYEEERKKALRVYKEYKREIANALRWTEENKDKLIVKDNIMVINAEDNILHTIAGTIASIVSKSRKDIKFIISMARRDDSKTKVSIRSVDEDARDIIKQIIDEIGVGETGGHKNAAGAIIPTEKEKEFVTKTFEIIKNNRLTK